MEVDAPQQDFIVPLEASKITSADLETAVRVLTAVAALGSSRKRPHDEAEDPALVAYKHSNLRPFRKALAKCLEFHQRTMYDGKSREEFLQAKENERLMKRQKSAETAQQLKYIETTALRKGRIERLKEKQAEAKEEELAKLKYMIPDGHVETNPVSSSSQTLLLTAPETACDNASTNNEEPIKLPKLRSCYVCKTRFRELHHFYDQLCPPCAALNWEKRHQSAQLDGKVAVVTGSRVKIGYQTCLKLLRAGANVVATTRFPNAAAATYRKEPDFAQWHHRLQVYGLDLRDVTGLEAFCRFLKIKFSESGIDILVNNACQTVRRPTAYYLPACEKEEELWQNGDETHKTLLGGCLQFEQVRRRLLLDHKQTQQLNSAMAPPALRQAPNTAAPVAILAMNETETTPKIILNGVEEQANNNNDDCMIVRTVTVEKSITTPFENTGISHSAAMSQMVLLPEDAGVSDSILPPGLTDINGQQLDLRKTNSWLLKMEEVSTPEVMECMYINAIAPFVLNSRLKPLMSIPRPHADRYIINVSAMEGKFYRYKMPNHPHTNMAKAALNMMTRTSAEDLAKNHGIYMNSVDTGWINDENPLERAHKTAEMNNFQTPIDEVDAAARILDPIFTGVNHPDQPKDYGKFLKDYHETDW